MSYLLQADEIPKVGLRRIAKQQIEGAIQVLSDDSVDRKQAVHQARCKCKKIRAILRLIDDSNREFVKSECANFRDAAAKLSQLRDTDVFRETVTNFRQIASRRLSRRILSTIDDVLTQRSLAAEDSHSLTNDQIGDFVTDMESALSRLSSWPDLPDGVASLISGFKRSYRRGRQAMKNSHRMPTNQALHRWRTWTKTQIYQSQLLKAVLPDYFEKRIGRLKRLGELLGDDHDLGSLRSELMEAADFSPVRQLPYVAGILEVIDCRRHQLQTRSFKLGKRVYGKRVKRKLSTIAPIKNCPG